MARKTSPSRWIGQALLATVLVVAIPAMVDAEPSAGVPAAVTAARATGVPAGGPTAELSAASARPGPAPAAPLDFASVVGIEPAGLTADAGIHVGAMAPQVDVGF